MTLEILVVWGQVEHSTTRFSFISCVFAYRVVKNIPEDLMQLRLNVNGAKEEREEVRMLERSERRKIMRLTQQTS